jgi:hypothetical protein
LEDKNSIAEVTHIISFLTLCALALVHSADEIRERQAHRMYWRQQIFLAAAADVRLCNIFV